MSSALAGGLLALSVALVVTGGQGAKAAGADSTGSYPERTRASLVASAIGPAEGGAGFSQDRVVVRTAPGAALPDLSALGLRGAQRIGSRGAYVVDVAPGTGRERITALLRELQDVPGVRSAERVAVRSACLIPNDPFYGTDSASRGQWSLSRIGMPAAWDVVTGSEDVVVALLDTGIDKDLKDFAGRIVSPYDAVHDRTDWPNWRDTVGHGTAVAGVAVAQGNDGEGMAGVAWNVKIMPVKISDSGNTFDYVLANGIYWAVDHGADVINISFAGEYATQTEREAIEYAVDNDVIVVAAAGNKAWKGIYYPAALPGVIAVGATEESPTNPRAFFSATGPELDLVAPGTDMWSYTAGASQWAWWSGTSFSTPMVTGVCALLRSLDPTITYADATDLLLETADDLAADGWDRETGWGIVDADEVVSLLSASATTTTSTSTTTTSTTTTTLPRFADVPPGTPYATQIEQLAARGVVEGSGDGLFHPQGSLTRQQFAKMTVLVFGYPVSEDDTSPFADVSHVPGQLYPYHYVAVAYHHGITEGTTPGHFSPYRVLTRAQMITMVARAAQLPDPPAEYVPPFPTFSPVHYPFARRAASAGLLDGLLGMGPDYDFLASATRGEACALLAKLLP